MRRIFCVCSQNSRLLQSNSAIWAVIPRFCKELPFSVILLFLCCFLFTKRSINSYFPEIFYPYTKGIKSRETLDLVEQNYPLLFEELFHFSPFFFNKREKPSELPLRRFFLAYFRFVFYFVPVEPKPPVPRSVSSKFSVSSTGITETGITTSCAMRSPGCMVYGSCT